MLLIKDLTREYAEELFKDDEKVLKFISDVKWEDGFVCKKCGHDNYCEGKSRYSRRCTRCKSEESATAHTMFHNCKFPVRKAFYIAYTVCVEGNKMSTYDYSDVLGINQMTCWKFRKKINDCLVSRENEKDTVGIKTILMSKS